MIGFRVDANEHIASGHLMRCISIGLECRKLGLECKFYIAEDKMTERLKSQNFAYQILNTKWNDLESELEQFGSLIEEDNLDWLVVDSYQVTNHYLSELNTICKVLYIDDMASEIYSVSALLHYAPWEETITYEESYAKSNVVVLAGTKYAPLREEFREDDSSLKRGDSILFTTGGTDPYNVTMNFLKHIEKSQKLQQYDIYVVVGNMNNHEPEIREYAQTHSSIHVLKNIGNMSYYMKTCSYAVSAGGTTLYELCASKIPTVCLSFADNQIDFAKKMDEKEVMLYAGDARLTQDIGEKIADSLVRYIDDEILARQRVKNMACLVDGKGAIRVAKFLAKND